MSQPCFSGAREGHDDAPFSDSRLCPANADKGKRRRKLESSFLAFSSSSPAVVEVAANGPSGPTRFRLKFLLKITVFLAVLHLVMMMRVNRKQREEVITDRKAPGPEKGQDVLPPAAPEGILFFAYGAEITTAEHYLQQAITSARRIKLLNPSTNITLVTNPGMRPDIDGAFDTVVNVEEKLLYSGTVQSWNPNGVSRQWLTRLEYLARSPYQTTLALDSQALCCATDVEDLLKKTRAEEFDLAFAVQNPDLLAPHNWAILYRKNENTKRLFNRWRVLQIEYSRAGSDQQTLEMAAGSLALQGKLNVSVISENLALATVVYNRTVPTFPKTSMLIDPGPVHFVHYDAASDEDAEMTCRKLNRHWSLARVVVMPAPFPKSEETGLRIESNYKMAYSEYELAEATSTARSGASFFRGLDWANTDGRRGRLVTPWQEHCPKCWEGLSEDVDAGIRRLFHNRANIWDSPAFVAEFGDDVFEWSKEEPASAIQQEQAE
ncbi:unnamed protein product [Ectocarpus sp. 6 AP-2014]